MEKNLLLIGGGGHCHSVIDSILALNSFDSIGIVDFSAVSYNGVRVVGTDEDIPSLFKMGWTSAFITVGSVGSTATRRRLYEMLCSLGLTIPTIIDPTAIVAKDAVIYEGAFIGKRAIVNAGCVIEKCAIINTGVIVEHDCHVGEFSHISTGAILCGQVSVGQDSHVGAGSVVRQQAMIGSNTLVGMGSVVVRDVPDDMKAFGNPCKVVE